MTRRNLGQEVAREATLGDLVNQVPAAAAVLERFGLDYCCGGSQTLGDACAARGIEPAAVLAEVAARPRDPAPDWVSLPPEQLVDHIEATHHAFLWGELPRLSALAERVARVHGDRHAELHEVGDTLAALRAEFEPHLLKEEQVLFPMIRALATATSMPAFHCGSVRNPISRMVMEHDQAGELLARLRTSSGGFQPPDDGCASYRAFYTGLAALEADTHLHVHKENNVLFPAVVALESRRIQDDADRGTGDD